MGSSLDKHHYRHSMGQKGREFQRTLVDCCRHKEGKIFLRNLFLHGWLEPPRIQPLLERPHNFALSSLLSRVKIVMRSVSHNVLDNTEFKAYKISATLNLFNLEVILVVEADVYRDMTWSHESLGYRFSPRPLTVDDRTNLTLNE